MQFSTVCGSIKTLGHEVRPARFFMNPTFFHFDPGHACHQVIGILDPTESLRIRDLFVLVSMHPIEFDEPLSETLWSRSLPRTKLTVLAVPGNNRFCARAASRSPDTEDILDSLLIVFTFEFALQFDAVIQHSVCKRDESVNLNLSHRSRRFIEHGLEFQRAHSAHAGIAEPLNGSEASELPSLTGEPRIDQHIAEFVRKAVRQHSGQAFECFL